MTSKAAQIMALAAQGLSTREIACEVYGISIAAPPRILAAPMAYVRVVRDQRKGQGHSKHDLAYRAKDAVKKHRTETRALQRSDPAYKEHEADRRRVWFRKRFNSDPEFRATHRNNNRLWMREKYHSDPAWREAQKQRRREHYRVEKQRRAVALEAAE